METGHGPEEYSFMQEVIKEEKMSLKKIIGKIMKWVALGAVFGVTACVSFFALKPWAEDTFQDDPEEVQIPLDEDPVVEQTPIIEQIEKELTIESYRELNLLLGQVATEAQKSIVHITGIKLDENWVTGKIEASYHTSGLIVADNGRELLILTNYSDVKNGQLFQARFADDTSHEAVLKQKDKNTNLAVFSVAKASIAEESWDKIQVAALGNSKILSKGRTLIALGSPFGSADGIGYGVASSLGQIKNCADGEYSIVVTDMPGSSIGNGFLFDSYGAVMGIIDSSLYSNKTNVLSAVGISAIKKEIELMSNGRNVPYVGVIGTMITEEMSEVQGIPAGLYVQEVEVDSPAMKAGIQSGDVLTYIGSDGIKTFENYHKAILAQEAGNTIKLSGYRMGAESYVDIQFNVTVGISQ